MLEKYLIQMGNTRLPLSLSLHSSMNSPLQFSPISFTISIKVLCTLERTYHFLHLYVFCLELLSSNVKF